MTIPKDRKQKLKSEVRAEAVNRLQAALNSSGTASFTQCVNAEEQTLVREEVKFICKVIGNL